MIARKIVSLLVGGAGPRVRLHFLIMTFFRDSGKRRFAAYFANRLQRKYGVFISSKADVPRTLKLRHPVGIVIGEGVKLGERVIIYQNVTLGGARIGDAAANSYPEIGDETVIFAGAVIVGKVKVGRNCVIGANAVVTRDVPDFSTAVGVPARIVGQRNDNF